MKNNPEEEFAKISTADIDYNEFNPRITLDDATIDDLTQSIKETGLIEPIVVRPKREGKPYEIITGARRFTAYRKARKKKIPARILEVDDDKAKIMCLVENLQRKDLDPIERAYGLQYLSETVTREEIAKKAGKSQTWVSHHLALLNLPRQIRNKIASGALGYASAWELTHLERGEGAEKEIKRIKKRLSEIEKQRGKSIDEIDLDEVSDELAEEITKLKRALISNDKNLERRTEEMEEILSEFWNEEDRRYIIPRETGRKRIRESVQSKNKFYRTSKEKREERFRRQQEKYEKASRNVIAEKEEILEEFTSILEEELPRINEKDLKRLKKDVGELVIDEKNMQYDVDKAKKRYEKENDVKIADIIRDTPEKERDDIRDFYNRLAAYGALEHDLETFRHYLVNVMRVGDVQRKTGRWRDRIVGIEELIDRMVKEGLERCDYCHASLDRDKLEEGISDYRAKIDDLLGRQEEVNKRIDLLTKLEGKIADKTGKFEREWSELQSQKRVLKFSALK